MRTPALLVLVRHAESARNRAKSGSTYFTDDEARQGLRGTPDHGIALTGHGHEQARQTGGALRDRFGRFDAVYTSGYARTAQTAQGLLDPYPPDDREMMRPRADLFLRERDPGFAYDMTAAEAQAAFPWLDEYWRTFGGFLARPPGGESLADVATRVQLFLERMAREEAGRKVLVVTHGGTLRCFRFLLEGWDYERARSWPPGQMPANCGVTVYRPDGDRLQLDTYNEVFWTVGVS